MKYEELVKYFGDGITMEILLLFISFWEGLKPWIAMSDNGIFCVSLGKTICMPPRLSAAPVSPESCCSRWRQSPTRIPSPSSFPCMQWLPMACHSLSERYLWLQECCQLTGTVGKMCWNLMPPEALLNQWQGRWEELPAPSGDKSEECALYSFPSSCRVMTPQWPPVAPCSLIHTSLSHLSTPLQVGSKLTFT